jgi:hypothetical protein
MRVAALNANLRVIQILYGAGAHLDPDGIEALLSTGDSDAMAVARRTGGVSNGVWRAVAFRCIEDAGDLHVARMYRANPEAYNPGALVVCIRWFGKPEKMLKTREIIAGTALTEEEAALLRGYPGGGASISTSQPVLFALREFGVPPRCTSFESVLDDLACEGNGAGMDELQERWPQEDRD